MLFFSFFISLTSVKKTAFIMAASASKVSPSTAKAANKTVVSPATQLIKYCLGIDVSKATLEVCLRSIDIQQNSIIKGSRSFSNGKKGHEALVSWMEKLYKDKTVPLVVVMEATGVYHEAIAYFLANKDYSLSIVVPSKAKKYLESLGQKSKDDKIDASGLSQMGCQQKLHLWQMPNVQTQQLRDLTRYLEFLHKQMIDCIGRLESYEHRAIPTDVVTKHLDSLQKMLKKQMKEVHKQIENHIKAHPDLEKKVACVTSINGVGVLTAAVVISEMNDFQLIDNQRQLVSYCGYDVVKNDSGTKKSKGKISKKGNAHVRRILYMPALNVVRLGVKHFVDLYQRVYERTKIKMVAYVAVQKKLLTTIYALYKKGEWFDPNFQVKTAPTAEVAVPVAA
jgi:transposase